jgi:hypothetical protein
VDDLINEIQERTGLSVEKATEVVNIVIAYMKNLVPDDLFDQVSGYVGSVGSAAGGAVDRATDVGGDWLGKATGSAKGLLGPDD